MLACSEAAAQQGGASSDTPKNLLVNGSFENGTEGWTLRSDKKIGKMAIDDKEKHGSKPALRVENLSGDETHLSQKVAVEPETRYRLEGYIKAKDLHAVRRDPPIGGAQLVRTSTRTHSEVVSGSKSWTKVSVEIVTGTESEIDVGGRLGYGEVVGTAWFSELSFVKLAKARPRQK